MQAGYNKISYFDFSSGLITGFEKAVDIGTPILKNLTYEVREYTTRDDSLIPQNYSTELLVQYPGLSECSKQFCMKVFQAYTFPILIQDHIQVASSWNY